MRIFSLIFTFFLALFSIQIGQADTPSAPHLPTLQPYKDQALEAITSFPKERIQEGDTAAAFYDRAKELLRNSGGQSDARDLMVKALYLDRTNAEYWQYYADILKETYRRDLALGALGQAASYEMNPTSLGRIYERIALGLNDIGHYKEALLAYRHAYSLAPSAEISSQIQRLEDYLRLQIRRSYADADGDMPKLCLEMNEELQAEDRYRYGDYIRIKPAFKPVFDVSGRQLCIGGGEYGVQYDITLLAGFRSKEGSVLEKTINFQQGASERNPSVRFRGATYVLPKLGTQGVPLYSVNVEDIDLQLYRIGERNLLREVFEGSFLRNISRWNANNFVERDGELIWKGQISVPENRNQEVSSSIPIEEMIPDLQTGMYALTAKRSENREEEEEGEDGGYYEDIATQWLAVTDIGLTTYQGTDGLDVMLRSLATAKPIKAAKVVLYGRNNEPLGQSASDSEGRVHFGAGLLRGTGGKKPSLVVAEAEDGSFSFLDVTRAAFDLSDRGVGGRLAPKEADLFLYADRGVYRPGEIVHLSGLIRNASGMAMTDLPLTLKILRPDGVELNSFVLNDEGAGSYYLAYPTSETGETGAYTAVAYLDPKGESIGRISFLVEEVVPAQIELKVETAATNLQPGETQASVALSADYYYGAPAAEMTASLGVTVVKDDQPFEDYSGFGFGPQDETFRPFSLEPALSAKTDASGKAAFNFLLPEENFADVLVPLRAVIRAEVMEAGGRPVVESLTLPVRSRAAMIGARLKEAVAVDWGSSGGARFDLVALDAKGDRIALPKARYRIIEIDRRYDWFYRGGNWDYEEQKEDRGVIQEGDIAIPSGSAPGELAADLQNGLYRLEVEDLEAGALTSIEFVMGWEGVAGIGDRPDDLAIAADKASYQPGETAHLRVVPPYSGEVTVAIATDRVHSITQYSVTESGLDVEIPVDASWGPGAYALVTAFRPGGQSIKDPNPRRAMGIVWLGIDKSVHNLEVSFDLPAGVRPNRSIEIPLKVKNARAGQQAYITLAAVDEGVLTLTDFRTPDPLGYIFGKRRLAVDVRDLYGRLIDGRAGEKRALRQGGDAGNNRRPAPTIQLVALFSGIVALDDRGEARVRLDIPDYNGRLRLMAVAYDRERVGSAEAGLVVREPVVANLSLPRFIRSGDRAELLVDVKNLEGPEGLYQASWTTSGGIIAANTLPVSRYLKQGQGYYWPLELSVPSYLGERGTIALTITGPDGFSLNREFALAIQPERPFQVHVVTKRLDPQVEMTQLASAQGNVLPQSAYRTVEIASVPKFNLHSLLTSLYLYPYGCLEQTTSRAFPLVYMPDLVEQWALDDLKNEADIARAELQKAIDRILEMQRWDGSFGLWDSASEPELWLSAYAMDFLSIAQEKGWKVPEIAFDRGLKWLEGFAKSTEGNSTPSGYGNAQEARVYAILVLARNGRGGIEQARYAFDNVSTLRLSTLSIAMLGQALSLYGDQARAENAFKMALDQVGKMALADALFYRYDYYASRLRDMAAIATLMLASRDRFSEETETRLYNILQRIAANQDNKRYLSTQEQGWLVRLAQEVGQAKQQTMVLNLDDTSGREYDRPLFFGRDAALDKVANVGVVPIWVTHNSYGIPAEELSALSEGFTITREYFTTDGKPMDISQVRQSDVIVAVISGKFNNLEEQALVVDRLPAGFELENARLANNRLPEELAWLEKYEVTPASRIEYRDDRFVAAFETILGGADRKSLNGYTFVYLLRAVTPGTYALPGAEIEAMYNPDLRGRMVASKVQILPAAR